MLCAETLPDVEFWRAHPPYPCTFARSWLVTVLARVNNTWARPPAWPSWLQIHRKNQ